MTKRPKLHKKKVVHHTFMIFFGWLIYLTIGYIAFHDLKNNDLHRIVVIALASALVVWIITHTWRHIHHRHHLTKNKRKHIPQATLHYDKDWLGYEVESEVEAIKKARYISVEIIDETVGNQVSHKKSYIIEDIK